MKMNLDSVKKCIILLLTGSVLFTFISCTTVDSEFPVDTSYLENSESNINDDNPQEEISSSESSETVWVSDSISSESDISDPLDEPEYVNNISTTQHNAINMLNYITVLTCEINAAKNSRLYLETTYSAINNNIHPNAVDASTQAQLTNILNTLEKYRMISVKSDRLQYLYEQKRAQAFRQAIPDPLSVMNVVKSGSILKSALSILYMTVDSVSNYAAATSELETQYLRDGWELEDQEAEELHNSRVNALNYMFSMVRDNSLPGDWALSEDAIKNFVEWKNKENLDSKIAWFESNQKIYMAFGPYWLELASCYYKNQNYEKCLSAFDQYELVTTRIFRYDYDYAEALPMAILAAKEIFNIDKYEKVANKYIEKILENTTDKEWALRYFCAQIYLDLFANTKHESGDLYLKKSYDIVFNNVNVLADEQRALNSTYLSDINEITIEKTDSKRVKDEKKQYNKYQKAMRSIATPPICEAFYLNCDLLFSLANELNITETEQKRIENIIHENGNRIFLASTLDDKYWFSKENQTLSVDKIAIDFDGEKIIIPAVCITDRSNISVTITNKNIQINDWIVKKVDRVKSQNVSDYLVTLSSKNANDVKYQVGDTINIHVTPVNDTPDYFFEFSYSVIAVKKALIFNGIKFERIAK